MCILKRNKKNKYFCNFLGESTKATSTTGIPILDGASPEPMSSEQLLLSTRYWIILFKNMIIEISISRKKVWDFLNLFIFLSSRSPLLLASLRRASGPSLGIYFNDFWNINFTKKNMILPKTVLHKLIFHFSASNARWTCCSSSACDRTRICPGFVFTEMTFHEWPRSSIFNSGVILLF